MKKHLITLPLISTIVLAGVPSVFADNTGQQTTASRHFLQAGQAGYVGALNDRPSNAPTSHPSPKSTAVSPLTVGYWYEYEPSTINVLMRTNNDPTASGTVSTYNFGYYLDNVLPNEWYASWPTQALEAGAVSIRSYGWYCTNNPKYPDLGADLDNTTNSQVFKPGTAVTSTTNAITATVDQALIYGSSEQAGFYKAGTYGPGRDSSSYDFYNNAYQYGEEYWGDQGYTYTWMLNYYYPGTSIITGSGSAY